MAQRLNTLPIIYVKGTHYEVGYQIGATFKSMIHEFLDDYSYLTEILIPMYNTDKGKQIYSETLDTVEDAFPQYIDEIRGTAKGANVPFFKLFLVHLDMILACNVDPTFHSFHSIGCSTVFCNQPGHVLLGHNEDALPGVLNHCYIVHGHIIEEVPRGKWKVREEKFASLCYAGHLPGFCMSFNSHGLAYSINVIVPETMLSKKTPRHFLTRALLSARNMDDVLAILRDKGTGIGDGVSVNLGFVGDETDQQIMYNIEVGPSKDKNESLVSVEKISYKQTYLHCNCYKHLSIPVKTDNCYHSSSKRERNFAQSQLPSDLNSVLAILGDSTDHEYPFFRNGNPPDIALTVSSGVFDFKNKTMLFYSKNPREEKEPLCTLSLTSLLR